MEEKICYLNGEFIKESEARISINDRGYLWGDSVYDVMRTFGHVPFRMDEHAGRTFRSCRLIDLDPGITREKLKEATMEVFKRNEKFLAPDEDYLIRQQISREEGAGGVIGTSVVSKPNIIIRCYEIPYKAYAKKYLEGVHIIVAETRRYPAQCLDPRAKVTSRLNNVLADREVRRVDPDAYALMLDINGNVAECAAQNIFMARDGKLLTPRVPGILEGITRGAIIDVAREAGIECLEKDLAIYDLLNADEVFITANSLTMFSVARLSNRHLGNPIPGPVVKRLYEGWNKMVGIDIVEQCMKHLND
jgi:branched-chain amino acid aminotransferase